MSKKQDQKDLELNALQMLMASFTQASQTVDTMYLPLIKRFKKLENAKKHFDDSFMLEEEIKCLSKLTLHKDMLIVAMIGIKNEKSREIGESMYIAFEEIFKGDRHGYKQFSSLAQDMVDETNCVIPDSVLESVERY